MLMQLGSVTFEVIAPNIDEWDRRILADYAVKDTMNNVRPREFMGPGEEAISMKGVLLPHKLGGFSSIEDIDKMVKSGNAQILVRGDGVNMGWFHIDEFAQRHQTLDEDGVGRRIEFTVSLVAAAKPAPTSYLSTLLRLFS